MDDRRMELPLWLKNDRYDCGFECSPVDNPADRFTSSRISALVVEWTCRMTPSFVPSSDGLDGGEEER
jgi:hypothetical protein